MLFRKSTVIPGLIAAGVLAAAPAAYAEWHGRGWGWHGAPHYYEHHHGDGGAAVAGALVGLGLGAIIGGVIASQPAYAPPPVTYAPPPAYYPPAYYPPAYGYAPYGAVE